MIDRLRLDKNECPYGFPDNIASRIKEAIASVEPNRYPDPSYSNLRDAIGRYVGTDRDRIVPGNGGDEILWLAFASFVSPGDRVLTLDPSFSQYEHMCRVFKAERVAVPMSLKGDQIEVDQEEFLRELRSKGPSLVLLDSPNNPTGISLPNQFIIDVLETAKCPVLIDEAYGEFSDRTFFDSNASGPLPESTMVLKTLSKAWGIAGLRVGYCVTSHPMAKKLNGIRSPFNVNVYSEAVALELLGDRTWLDERIKSIVDARERLYNRIKRDLPDWQVFPSQGNFLLVRLPGSKENVISLMKDQQVEIKGFDLPWDGSWARITVGKDEEIDKLIDIMEKI